MSLRGRLSVAALLCVPILLALVLTAPAREALERFEPAALARWEWSWASDVAAAAGPVGAVPRETTPRPMVPASVLGRLPDRGAALEVSPAGLALPGPRFVETLPLPLPVTQELGELHGPLRVEYAFDAELTRRVQRVLNRARVRRGHAILLEVSTGRVLTYVSTDPDAFPPERTYPAASLVKVVTAAAALHHARDSAERPCRYDGNPYRLRRSQIHPPRRGREVSLEGALASSNNHCFAQLAVHSLGSSALLDAIRRFGWLEPPAAGHQAGSVEATEDDYDLGRLGCGLATGSRITPLHAAQLAATLADGRRVEPWWIHRVLDAEGRSLELPRPRPWRQVMTPELADELRAMLVRTTTRGTARSAFRDRRGRPRLGPVQVAGKTGNLSGRDPKGRYEWFAGLAPAEQPTIAVAVVQLHDDLWWQNSATVAAGVLAEVFCESSRCRPDLAGRYTHELGTAVEPIFLSESGR